MSAPNSARRRLGVVGITSVAAVAATVLVPTTANADPDPASRTIAFASTDLATDGWGGDATGSNASSYDFQVVGGKLRASNWVAGGQRGNITQLTAPIVQTAGEPFYTSATHDGFSASFTLDSALSGDGDHYAAQPGLSLELDADQDGNRAGGGVTFRVPTAHTLEISNYFSKPLDLGETWRNVVTTVPFTTALNITYAVKFVAGGDDVVTVSVNGSPVLTGGGTFEGYSLAVDNAPQTVNSILLRAISREPGAAVGPTSWNNVDLTDDQNAALKGNGLLFSNIHYGSTASADETVFPHTSTVTVQKSYIKGYEDSNPASPTFDYTSWHVTRGDSENGDVSDPGPSAFDVTNHALQLFDPIQNGHSVQLIKGFDGDAPTSLRQLVNKGIAWDQPAGTTGPAYFQLPLYIDGNWNGTLYPANPTVGFNAVKLTDLWVGTKSIGTDYVAHTPVPLSDILDALDGKDTQFSGFGIASSGGTDGATTSVSALYFDGVKYVFANDPSLLISPVVVGTPKVGNVLTVNPNANYTGITYHYQWYRESSAISKATGAGYALVAADLGHTISVKVTASKSGFVSVAKTSPRTAKVVAGTITVSGAPTITGTLKVGQKLTAVRPVFSPTGTTFTYRWYRNNVAIVNATAATYTLTASDLATTIRVRVTASKAGFTAVGVTSAPTAAIDFGVITVSKIPTITGTARIGYTLTGHTTGWNVSGLTVKYSWYANGELIQLSTSPYLKLSAEEKGKTISLTVRGWKLGYTPTVSFSSLGTATIH